MKLIETGPNENPVFTKMPPKSNVHFSKNKVVSFGPQRNNRRQRRRFTGNATGDRPYLGENLLKEWSKSNDISENSKMVAFRDDAIISMAIGGELTDASIVAVGSSRPQYQYSREELMKIKTLPLSKKRPDCLESAFNNSKGTWDPERWHMGKKRSETPEGEKNPNCPTNENIDNNNTKRRSVGDPRDRIRKEQDGIVLSPQRRSFNTGCFVNVSQAANKRPESPPGKTEIIHREPSVRRIGSGRILSRDMWDFRPENEKLDPEYGYRPNTGSNIPSLRDRDRERHPERDRERHPERDRHNDRDERFERRSFGRDFGNRNRERLDNNPDRSRIVYRRSNGGNESGYNRYDNRNHTEYEEPEWFSSGPTSQHETIELRGFDDVSDDKSNNNSTKTKKLSPGQRKRTKKQSVGDKEKDEKAAAVAAANAAAAAAASTAGDVPVKEKDISSQQHLQQQQGPKGRSTPTSMDQPINSVAAPHSPIDKQNEPRSPREKNGKSESVSSSQMSKNTTTTTEPSTMTDQATDQSSTTSQKDEKSNDDNGSFNLEDFLKSDTFPPGLLTNGVGSNAGASSRFSQWFKRESPVQQIDRRTPIHNELLNNLLNDITEPNIHIPQTAASESATYFAPISPANSTNNASNAETGTKLLEMLQRNNKLSQENVQQGVSNSIMSFMKNVTSNTNKEIMPGGAKVVNLEELEAHMRGASNELPKVNKSQEDLSAFKKLLAQISGGHAVPATNGPGGQKTSSGVMQQPPMQQQSQQPVTLMQLLHNQLKNSNQPTVHQGARTQRPANEPMQMAPTFNNVGPLGPTQHSNVQHENLMKVLQIQQQQQHQQQQQRQKMLSLMMAANQQQQKRMPGISPIPPDVQMLVNNTPSARELLQRPEAEAIIRGLQQGELTRQHLIQQLQNPAMQHRHREVLVSILKYYDGPQSSSPHSNAPTPQDHLLQQILYQQHQRIPSPMNNVMQQQQHKVPSPRDLAAHNQTIIQNALLKKKYEEQQRENYRKRQDQQQQLRSSSPSGSSPVKQLISPTPLAFTPTSVLRKMTAEKDPEGCPEPMKQVSQNLATSTHLHLQSTNVQMVTQGVTTARHATSTVRSQQTALSSQANWPNPTANIKQHPGRPIVKGSCGSSLQHIGNMDPRQQQQQPQISQQQQLNPQQNQQRVNPSIFGNLNVMRSKQQQQMVPPQNTHSMMPPGYSTVSSNIRTNQIPPNTQFTGMQQQQQQAVNAQLQQILNQNFNSTRTDGIMRQHQFNRALGSQNPSAGPRLGSNNGGDLSPTSNQLARWFSPEVLAQAKTVKLPELSSSNVLSLEELERLQHASTTVHH